MPQQRKQRPKGLMLLLHRRWQVGHRCKMVSYSGNGQLGGYLSGRRWRLQQQRRLQQRPMLSLHRRQPCRLRLCNYLCGPLRSCSLPGHWPEQLMQRLQQLVHSLQAPVQTQDGRTLRARLAQIAALTIQGCILRSNAESRKQFLCEP
jgi:hypothetical protein